MEKKRLKEIFSKPYNAEDWQQVLIDVFGANILRKEHEPLTNGNDNVEGFELGVLTTKESDGRRYEIGLYEYEIKQKHRIELNRVGLRSLVKSFTRFKVDAALVVFYDKKHWRLSLICDIHGEKTAPKRFTYLFGSDKESYRTPIERFQLIQSARESSYDIIKDAFAVDKLGDDFYIGYEDIYKKFCKFINNDSQLRGKLIDKKQSDEDKAEKPIRDYVKKMMGRLAFLQFLQKKQWMGVPADCEKWKDGKPDFLQDLYKESNYKDDFLEKVLKPLFFETLNKPRENDIAPSVLGNDIRIPYLNGGLFEKDDIDKIPIKFPEAYFKEFFDFFGFYNFTIDENDPDDSDIGIDPEMLGRIFEGLLEDNRGKGVYYTPKEIVRYMCKISLIEYLQTNLGKHSEIENFIKNHDAGDRLSKKNYVTINATKIEQLLDDIKVCDPAIGSGAFPMGMLNEILRAKMTLDLTINIAETKKNIIQKSIHGVDIEQGAVDIARLRFWLSLIVDEEEPHPLPNLDYKIMQGDSLREKFEGYDLNVLYEQEPTDLFSAPVEEKDIVKLQNELYNTTDHDRKDEIKKDIHNIILDHIRKCLKNAKKQLTNDLKKTSEIITNFQKEVDNPQTTVGSRTKYKKRVEKEEKQRKLLEAKLSKIDFSFDKLVNIDDTNRPFFLWRLFFKDVFDNGGFDVVIGNPPYLRIQGIKENDPDLVDYLTENYKSATGSYDLYATFTERAMSLIKNNGIVNLIMPDKWTNSAFGKGLREIIIENNAAYRIISFGAYQVFNASTYTALQWFRKGSENLEYTALDHNLSTNKELGDYLDGITSETFSIVPPSKLTENSWVLTTGSTSYILDSINVHSRTLRDIFDKIYQGIATSKDDVYFLEKCIINDDVVVAESKQLGKFIEIERDFVKPLLMGDSFHKYEILGTDTYVVFPYYYIDNKPILFTEKDIAEKFPKGYAYLKECESALRDREKGRYNVDGEWFQFSRKQGMSHPNKEKLVAPYLTLGGNFTYDENGEFYINTKVYGYIKKSHIEENNKFWLGILNSRVLWYHIVSTGSVFRGGYYVYAPDYVNTFAVPKTFHSNGIKLVEALVEYLIFLTNKTSPKVIENEDNKRLVIHMEDILNMIIYELYFEAHMTDNNIDVLQFINIPPVEKNASPLEIAKQIENLYFWYQKPENPVRQRIMLIETRSKDFLHIINQAARV